MLCIYGLCLRACHFCSCATTKVFISVITHAFVLAVICFGLYHQYIWSPVIASATFQVMPVAQLRARGGRSPLSYHNFCPVRIVPAVQLEPDHGLSPHFYLCFCLSLCSLSRRVQFCLRRPLVAYLK